jgi:hypothetical protein
MLIYQYVNSGVAIVARQTVITLEHGTAVLTFPDVVTAQDTKDMGAVLELQIRVLRRQAHRKTIVDTINEVKECSQLHHCNGERHGV